MSQKWIRSKRWDDQYIPRWAWPVKAVLRALSSIWLAVILLTMVALYGALASVPIGLIAAAPTYALYGLSLLAAIAVVAGVPAFAASAVLRRAGARGGARVTASLILFAVLAAGTFLIWREAAWPRLRYDFGTGQGFMLFADFVQRYSATTLRRLPGMEMSELEFYSWWPLKAILLTFVLNLIVATVRRIEFTFVNIGVLTVHGGIVVIALGSIYYAGAKQEGDMFLLAGPPDAQGNPTPGPEQDGFFDNTQVVLWVGRGRGEHLEQRPIRRLPRYNDYNLNALEIPGEEEAAARHDRGRKLSIPVPPPDRRGAAPAVDEDFRFEIVGYASYATLESRWIAAPAPTSGEAATPMRRLDLVSSLPSAGRPQTVNAEQGGGEVVRSLTLLPDLPAERIATMAGAIAVEYGRSIPEQRWRDLGEVLPEGAHHGLIVEVPRADGEEPERHVFAVEPGTRIEVGTTGYTVEVEDLTPQPPFPIITPGFQGAESSVAIVRVTPPAESGAPAFTRYVYHRFPELDQDIVGAGSATQGGRPARRAADPSIRIAYVDASMLQVYLDEIEGDEGAVRAIVRLPGREPIVSDRIATGQTLTLAPMVGLRLGERSPHAVRVETPVVVPEQQRDREMIGTHGSAAVAVRISLPEQGWSRTVWVPFARYFDLDPSLARRVTAPDGREVTVVFGRLRHTLPGLRLQLADFQMFPYPHSDLPQDYRSDLIVLSAWDQELTVRSTSLNAPLLIRVPFQPMRGAPAVVNLIGRLVSLVAPNQYKFSQASWDPEGWRSTKAMADEGLIPRPRARYTILGVGNNPGIYVIAAGAVMMCVGIPWAFYLKPYLVRRRKRRIQAELAAARGAAAEGAER
jgi:hypothetical protein